MVSPISEEQLALNRSLHQSDPAFGNRSHASGVAKGLPLALKRMHETGLCSSVLDYGTGKGLLVKELRRELPDSIKVTGYDPAVKNWSARPEEPHDILTCLDVLEHVEIGSIDSTLKDIESLTKLFVSWQLICSRLLRGLPTAGMPTFLAPAEWWVARFSQVFSCLTTFPVNHLSGVNRKLILAAHKHLPSCACLLFYE